MEALNTLQKPIEASLEALNLNALNSPPVVSFDLGNLGFRVWGLGLRGLRVWSFPSPFK